MLLRNICRVSPRTFRTGKRLSIVVSFAILVNFIIVAFARWQLAVLDLPAALNAQVIVSRDAAPDALWLSLSGLCSISARQA